MAQGWECSSARENLPSQGNRRQRGRRTQEGIELG